jgi:uncharacterized membrane protein YdjX (TVP38/TMEM64 family)
VKREQWRWAGLAALLVALFAASRLLPVAEWLRAFQEQVTGMGVMGGVLYGLVYVLAALLFVPGSVLTIGAGVVFGVAWGTVVVAFAATTAAGLAFLIARYLARERVEAMARKNAKFGAIDRAIQQQGWKVVALLRLSPVIPYNLSNYLYGLTAVRFGPYLLASAIGMLPGTLLYVYLGAIGNAAAGGERRGPLEWALLGAGLAATVAVTVLLTRTARRHLAHAQG